MNVDKEILSINDFMSDAINAFDKFQQLTNIAHKLMNEILADIDNIPTTKGQREILHLQANKLRNYRVICDIIGRVNKNQIALRKNHLKGDWTTYNTSDREQKTGVVYCNDIEDDAIIIYAVND